MGEAETGSAAAVGRLTPPSRSDARCDNSTKVMVATMPTPAAVARATSHLFVWGAGAGSCAERATACTLANVPAPATDGTGSDATSVAPSPKLGELSGRGVAG